MLDHVLGAGADGQKKNDFIQKLLKSLKQHKNFVYIKVKPCPRTGRRINFVVTAMLVSSTDEERPLQEKKKKQKRKEEDENEWYAEHCIVTADKEIPRSLQCSYWTDESTYDVTMTATKEVAAGEATALGNDNIHPLQEKLSVHAYYSNGNPCRNRTNLTEVMHNMSFAMEAWEKQLRPCCCSGDEEGQAPPLLKQTICALEIRAGQKTPIILFIDCGRDHQPRRYLYYPIHDYEGPFRDPMIPARTGMVCLKDVLYSCLRPEVYWSTNGEKMFKAFQQADEIFGNRELTTFLMAVIRNVKTKYKDFSMIPVHQTKVIGSAELIDKLLLAEHLYTLRLAHKFRKNVQTMSPLLRLLPTEIFALVYSFVKDSYRKDVADAQKHRSTKDHMYLKYPGFCVDLTGCHWRFL
jgi:hypothetical protein